MEVSVRGKANPKGKSMLELDTELYEAPDINQFAFSAAQSFCPISLWPDNVKTWYWSYFPSKWTRTIAGKKIEFSLLWKTL